MATIKDVAARAGILLANCLYLDVRTDNLDTARRLGMATVLLGPADPAARAAGHGHAADLRDLLARRRGAGVDSP